MGNLVGHDPNHLDMIVGNTFSDTLSLITNTTSVASTTSVSCPPHGVVAGDSSACTATVTGSNPTGTVSFTSDAAGGTFSSPTCTLSAGTTPAGCQVSYSPDTTVTGSQTITATYSGDSLNLASAATDLVGTGGSVGPAAPPGRDGANGSAGGNRHPGTGGTGRPGRTGGPPGSEGCPG